MKTPNSPEGISRRELLALAAAGLSNGVQAQQDLWSLVPRASSRRDLSAATGWLNSDPVTLAGLRGQAVLVQFWTYTCVNWQRTLPFIKAWHDKYAAHGLRVIGVHTPEFSFEQELANVRQATAALGIPYPVALDNRQAIWKSFGNNAWPALYLLDASGKLRFSHDGEGEYERTEAFIQRVLKESGAKETPAGIVRPEARGAQVGADWAHMRSPETYAGYAKAERFATQGGMAADRISVYAPPASLAVNRWSVAGEWMFEGEAARANKAGARLLYRFEARDVNVVLSSEHGAAIPFRVRIDGKPPGAAHGSDCDADGRGVLAEPRLYQLVRQSAAVQPRLFEIEFLEPGTRVYAFTFG